MENKGENPKNEMQGFIFCFRKDTSNAMKTTIFFATKKV